MNITYDNMIIRTFQEDDLPLLGKLYEDIMQSGDTVFWWIGEPTNWENVYGAFANGTMIAKGQVSIVSIITSGSASEHRHSIYLNLKAAAEYQSDHSLLHQLYQPLLHRARQLKATLPATYQTMLCIGNYATESANTTFFQQNDYQYLNSQFHMTRSLSSPILPLSLPEDLVFGHWLMETPAEQEHYLEIDLDIWPEAPIGLQQLNDNRQQPFWTCMVIRYEGEPIGGLMVWKEEEEGVIEDVWVRPDWRQRGIARYLLTEALMYLQQHGLHTVGLTALTDNDNALSLYQSVGFTIEKEEVRYGIILDD
ncbi:GNAT family N-acetyltransferase [Paenibacillus kandeliae]|uniref:GNAT family N-acetyltransferase n=1 Tax=Paenibacillus kandeliae TaxID=3231269 RepID=UPI0034573D51